MKSFDYLRSKGVLFSEIRLSEIPRSAQDVERLYGCPLHQVLKTLVFVSEKEPLIVVLPGDKRVDMEKLKSVTGQAILRMAKPAEVEAITGYSIGGITPFGIEKQLMKVIDSSVFSMPRVNIGSGKAEIGIELRSEDLRKIWDGEIAEVVT